MEASSEDKLKALQAERAALMEQVVLGQRCRSVKNLTAIARDPCLELFYC